MLTIIFYHHTGDGTCSLRCPIHFYKGVPQLFILSTQTHICVESQWRAHSITSQVLGWLGLIGLIIVLIPFLAITDRREAPTVMQTCLLISKLSAHAITNTNGTHTHLLYQNIIVIVVTGACNTNSLQRFGANGHLQYHAKPWQEWHHLRI